METKPVCPSCERGSHLMCSRNYWILRDGEHVLTCCDEWIAAGRPLPHGLYAMYYRGKCPTCDALAGKSLTWSTNAALAQGLTEEEYRRIKEAGSGPE